MRLILFLICAFFCTGYQGQPPQYLWTNAIKGTGFDQVSTLHTDSKGFVYAAGYFNGTSDLDPGAGTLLVTSSPTQNVVYLCKFDPMGSLVWARWIDGPTGVSSMCTDNSGNIYVTGLFSGQVDFDPTSAVYSLTAPGSGGNIQSCYIWKLSSAGQFLGAGSFGGGPPIIRFDGQQNIYCSGNFKGAADVDPGAGVSTVTLTANLWNAYILKIDLNLNLIWSGFFRSLDISTIDDFEIAPSGDLMIGIDARETGTIDIDPGPSVTMFNCNGKMNTIAVRVNPAGNLVSLTHLTEGIPPTGGLNQFNLELDNNHDLFITASLGGSVIVNPGPGAFTLTPGLSYLNFIFHFDNAGNFVKYDTLNAVPTWFELHNDTLIISGSFGGNPDLDPSLGSFSVTSNGAGDVCLFALDKSFSLQWAQTFGGPGNDHPYQLSISNAGELYIAGSFSNTCEFDPGPGSVTITSQAATDGFISKFSPCPGLPVNISSYIACAGETASLVASAASSVSWYQNSTGGFALATGSVYITSVLSMGTHTFYASAVSCSLFPRTPFVFFAAPVPSLIVAAPSVTTCPGNFVTISATGASSIHWVGGPSTASYAVGPLASTIYTAQGTDPLTGCMDTETVQVIVTQCPGLDEIQLLNSQLYPNPTDGLVTFKTNRIQVVYITALDGRIVSEHLATQGANVIDLRTLLPGIYLLKSENRVWGKVVLENSR